ncbi:PspC domain-containing protein [Bacillus lacus]|uniref:PspC domain-containing protein n=1 Tax=Metabacillus lacus TaxID=1983721 RepID=A0A7X2IZB6_9BACI|nr:PspC domain-containing protein [Metabacillus lacus]
MKRLVRSRHDRKLSGVLGGLAAYSGLDATLLRVIYAVAFIFTGFFPLGIAYIAGIILMPNESEGTL